MVQLIIKQWHGYFQLGDPGGDRLASLDHPSNPPGCRHQGGHPWPLLPGLKMFSSLQRLQRAQNMFPTYLIRSWPLRLTNSKPLLTRASINLIRWSSSNPPGSCFLSSWSPWFTWAPSLAAFYQGNTVLKMFLIKRHVYFSIVFNQRYSGSTWRWRSLRLNCPLQLRIRRFSKKSTQCQND